MNTAQPAGQAQAHPRRLRQAQEHQARHRHAGAGQQADRPVRSTGVAAGRAGDLRDMGNSQVQADDPGSSRCQRLRFRRDHSLDSGEVAGSPAARQGRSQRARPHHHPAQGRWPQARLPRDRLPSQRQGRRQRQGRAHRVRPEPHRQHRAAALRRRREALHHCAAGTFAGRRGRVRARTPTSSRATTCRCATSRPVP